MMEYNFSYYLSNFLGKYLPGVVGVSTNTVLSYRDTFVLYLRFMKTEKNIPAERMKLLSIDAKCFSEFLDWLEMQRHCSVTTRNVRLAAIHAFFRYLQYEAPECLNICQKVLAIPFKKTEQRTLNYFSLDGIKLLLNMPDTSTKSGRRDLALLSLMYDTGARVQEIADLTPQCIRFEKPATIRIHGKGNKTRIVPMMEAQVSLLKQYMLEQNLLKSEEQPHPLFRNKRGEKLTRAGISYILDKYVSMAREANPELVPNNISCHCLRHSKAMHLLQSGVNLVYIRDFLGHYSVQTTEVYAKADSQQKRQALEKAYVDVTPNTDPVWQENSDLLEWLVSLGK